MMTQDEGQERREAKTQEGQEDKRQETLEKEMEITRKFEAKGKTGRVDSQQGL